MQKEDFTNLQKAEVYCINPKRELVNKQRVEVDLSIQKQECINLSRAEVYCIIPEIEIH